MRPEASIKYLTGITVLILLFTGLVFAQPSDIPRQDPSQVDIDPELESKFESQGFSLFSVNTEHQDVIVRLEDVNASEINDRKVKASSSQSPIIKLAERNPNIEVKNRFWIANAVHLEVSTKVPLENIAGVKGVERLHHNFEVHALQSGSRGIPESSVQASSGPSTYGLNKINATESWEKYGTRGESVRVSVLDTGIDVSHPDLELYTDNVSDPTYPGGWAEFDSGRIDSEPNVPSCSGAGHGTHVSGTVAGGNSSGLNIGVAPGVELMHAGVLMKSGINGCSGSFVDIINGIQWSVDNDADIISMSLGASGYNSDFIEPIRNAEDAGIIMIAASGNSGHDTSIGPGNVYESFAVGAVNSNNNVASFSSGEKIDASDDWGTDAPVDWPFDYIVPDVAAPGVNVNSTVPGGGYDSTYSGTSMATPHVSGAAALMQSATYERLAPSEIKEAFEATAWKPSDWDESSVTSKDGKDDRYGKGIIDAYNATSYAIENFDTTYNITELNVNETTINKTEFFNVSGQVENLRPVYQNVTLDFRINDSTEDTVTYNLSENETRSFNFVQNISAVGFYELKVNDRSAGGLNVVMPLPNFSISANVSKSELVEGESAVVSGVVDNAGGTGKADLRLLRNGTEINSTSLDIGFESSEAYSFNNTFDNPGFYELKINNTTAGTLNVQKDAELNITDLFFVNSGKLFENETVDIVVSGENIGDIEGNLSFDLLVDGAQYSSKTFEINPGASIDVEFTNSHSDRGNYTYSSGGLNKTLEVLQPGSVELLSSSLEDQMVEGNKYNYSVTVENPGDVQVSKVLEFSQNGSVYETVNSTINASSKLYVNSSQRINNPGLYEISVNDSLNKTVDVLEKGKLNQTGLDVEEEIVEGENITANTTVTNIGEVSSSFDVYFNVTGPEEYNDSKTVILGGSNSTTVNYSRNIDPPGNYSLNSLNRTRNFTLLNDADIRINSSSLNTSEIFTGNRVEASTTVDNIGDVNGTDFLNISLNDQRLVPTGNVEPGEKTLIDIFRPLNSGSYNLTVNGTDYENVKVKRPYVNLSNPEFNVSESGLIKVNFSLNNTDPGFVNETVSLSINNSNQKNSTFNLEPGERSNFTATLDWNETGFYSLELNNSEIGNFSLDHYAEFSGLSPDGASFEQGDSVGLSGKVDSVGSPNITVKAGSKEFETDTSSGLSNFSFSSVFDPGSYEWSVVASFDNSSFQSDSLSFEVQEEESSDEGGGGGGSGGSGGGFSGGLGGGAISEPELEVEENDDSIRIDAPEGTHSIEFNDSGLPIRTLDFEASEPGTINFTSSNVQHSASMESVFDAESELEGPFNLSLRLSREWLEENRFNESQASFFRYEDGWNDLRPQSEQEQDYITYTKDLESFSTFGLGVDQACYSMEEVDAVVDDSCRTYENICDVPESAENVQSCSLFERQQSIEREIERAKEDGSVDQQEVSRAEQAFRTGDFEKAERILESSQTKSRIPEIEIESFNIVYLAVPVGLIILSGLFIVIRPYYRRKRLISRLEALTEELRLKAENEGDFQQLANMVARADEALLEENYEEAGKIIANAEKMA